MMRDMGAHKTWTNLLGADVDEAAWELTGPNTRSLCHGPMAAIAAVSVAMTALSTVASMSAQAQQGAAAAQQGQLRQQQMTQQAQIAQMQADQLRVNANNEMGTAERAAIEQKRKGDLLASRATAVMAASGGGVDRNLVASIVGEGTYNENVSLYTGKERARSLDNQAALKDWEASSDQWSGNAAAQQGAFAQESAGTAEAFTAIGGIGKAASSVAAAYGGGGGAGALTAQSGGFSALSAGDTMKNFNSMPSDFTRPGMGVA